MSAEAEDDYKRCPDCAELVRAHARKCRFCGYRFDRVEPQAARRRAGEPTSVADLLSDWGTELESDEEIAFFLTARVKKIGGSGELDADGFLLITDRRLLLFKPLTRSILGLLRRGPASTEVVLSLSFSQIDRLSIERRRRKAELRLGDELLIGDIPSETLEKICHHLERRA